MLKAVLRAIQRLFTPCGLSASEILTPPVVDPVARQKAEYEALLRTDPEINRLDLLIFKNKRNKKRWKHLQEQKIARVSALLKDRERK